MMVTNVNDYFGKRDSRIDRFLENHKIKEKNIVLIWGAKFRAYAQGGSLDYQDENFVNKEYDMLAKKLFIFLVNKKIYIVDIEKVTREGIPFIIEDYSLIKEIKLNSNPQNYDIKDVHKVRSNIYLHLNKQIQLSFSGGPHYELPDRPGVQVAKRYMLNELYAELPFYETVIEQKMKATELYKQRNLFVNIIKKFSNL
jgi:hypothetical protein